MQKNLFITRLGLTLFSLLIVTISQGAGGQVTNSKHDLNSGTAAYKEVCVFCHTPHNANPNLPGLWNRRLSDTSVFTFYSSPTMDSKLTGSAPSGVSLLCLSCHDDVGPGTAVVGTDAHSLIHNTGVTPNCILCHQHGSYSPKLRIGPNLANDHPISIPYPTAAQDPKFKTPPDLKKGWPDVRLYDGKIECATCHNPHDPDIVPFLRKSNSGSGLCFTCHDK